ncbi:MAG: hypothetical protein EXS37_20510 [Opitutus sp.]|nr:hypothetical protein [Opitutus sp.]
MNALVPTALAGLLAGAAAAWAQPVEFERNAWPASVRYLEPASQAENWTAAGPFLFNKPLADADGNTANGFRPFWVQLRNPQGDFRAGHFLYPLFSYSRDESTYKWSVFELIRRTDRVPDAAPAKSDFEQDNRFEIFPLWFYRQTHDDDLNYRGFFPIAGTIKNKLGFERLSWTLFPFYVENEKRGAVTTSTPWPIVRVTRGAAHGWGVWPIFNFVERPGVSRSETYLWPLGYNLTHQPAPDDPPGTPPRRDIGALPFYTRSTGPGYISEDYAWPFFGYTERTQPKPYSERRYLWPFLVQGRGDDHFVNRWAPLYSHSIIKGYDKQWFAWPLVRHARWDEEGIERTRSQFLYFVYWNEEQRAAGRANSPTARLTHVWPLLSDWDNGAGRHQWQLFSPFDVFFPGNEKVRLAWSPLFAIARHERRASGDTRTSLLWNFVTWEKHVAEERSELHLGPLLSVAQQAGDKRVAIGNGLFGFKRTGGDGWKMFWLDFPEKPARDPSASH